MFSFTKTDKSEKKETSIVSQIKSFAPMIKQFTGYDIDGILPLFLTGINDAKKRLGSEIMLMITSTDTSFILTVYEADQVRKVMNAIHTCSFSTTFEAIEQLDQMSQFLKSYNPTTENDTTSATNADTATSGSDTETEPASTAGAASDTGSDTDRPTNGE